VCVRVRSGVAFFLVSFFLFFFGFFILSFPSVARSNLAAGHYDFQLTGSTDAM
jgi:hypothetical protein